MADWRKDLEKAYQKGAKWAVKDSNKTYDKTISDTGRDALTRGLGRSSYTTQTLANLQTDKNEAGNRIRSEFELEYLKELQQRELEEEKLAEQKRQFDLQMAMSGGGGGGGGGYYPRPDSNNDDGTGNNNNPNWWDALNNWRYRSAATANALQNYVGSGGGRASYSPTALASRGLGNYATSLTR